MTCILFAGLAACIFRLDSFLALSSVLMAVISVVLLACVLFKTIRAKIEPVLLDKNISLDTGYFNAQLISRLLLSTLLIWCFMTLAFLAGYGAVLENLNLAQAMILVGAVNLSFLFAFAPGNIIGYQMAALSVFAYIAVPADTGLSSAILFHAVTLFILSAFGLLALLRNAMAGVK